MLQQLLTAKDYRVYSEHTDVPPELPVRRGIVSNDMDFADTFMDALLETFPDVPHKDLHCVVDVHKAEFVQLTVYAQ
jgi:hypothetical protein